MAIFKCKMCGGTLEINEEENTAICEYCGTKQTVPTMNYEAAANVLKNGKVKHKKTSRIKKLIEACKDKRKEKSKYGLDFLNTSLSTTIYFICLLLNVFFFFKIIATLPPIEYWTSYLFVQVITLLIPTAIVLKKPLKKMTAIIVHSIGTLLCIWLSSGCGDLHSIIADGFFLLTIVISFTNLLLLVLVLCTRKVDIESINNKKNHKIFFVALIVSTILSTALSFGGTKFCDYQFAKMFYHLGAYEYADEYFNYVGNYKDSDIFKRELLYVDAENLYKEHRYSEAIMTLRTLGEFPDSKDLNNKIKAEMNNIASECINPELYTECTIEELYKNPQKYHRKKVVVTSLKVLCNFEDKAWSKMAHYNALLCDSDETNDGSSSTGNTWYGYYSDYLLPYNIPYVGVQGYGGVYISEHKEMITVYGTFTYNSEKSEGDRISGEPHIYNIVADCCIE